MLEFTIEGIVYRQYDHIYLVAEDGSILQNFSPYTPVLRPDGYYNVGRQRLWHRMVAACWLDNPNGAKQVHHKDKDRSNNHSSNLEWLSPKDHAVHHNDRSRYIRTDATREKIRQLRLGSKTSEETKQKQREASLRLGCRPPSFLGQKMPEHAVKKLIERNNKRCMVDGIIYDSFKIAAEAIGIKQGTIRRRLFSKNFPTYVVL